MSLGNLNTSGNQKKNTPYQLAMVKLLAEIAAIGPLGCCPTAATEVTLAKLEADFTDTFNPVERTPGFVRITGILSIPAGLRSLSVYNSGGADGVFQTEVIKPGERFSYDAGGQTDTLDQFDFDGTGTELVITTIL